MDAWNDKSENQLETADALTADEAPENDNKPGESFTGPDDGASILTPGSDIVLPEETPQEIEVDTSSEPEAVVTHFGRAVELLNDEVTNVLRVVLDEDDNVVGFSPEPGYELVVLDENDEVSIGDFRIDGKFVNPDDE